MYITLQTVDYCGKSLLFHNLACLVHLQLSNTLTIFSIPWPLVPLYKNKKQKVSIYTIHVLLTPHTLTSECIFVKHFLRCWQGEFVLKSWASLVFLLFSWPQPYHAQDLIFNSSFCLPYHSYDATSENWVMDLLENSWTYISLYSHHLSDWYCIDIVRRNSVLVTHGG